MSEEVYSIPLVKLAQEFSLEEIVIPDNYNDGDQPSRAGSCRLL